MERQEEFAELHSAPFPEGMHCSAAGAFVNNVPLLRRVSAKVGRQNWAPRDPDLLSVDLGSGYCLEIEAKQLLPEFTILAKALNKGDLSAAAAILATMDLPAFPKRTNGRLNRAEQSPLAKTLRELSLLKGDEAPKNPDFEERHPRQPKNSPGGVGGQFAPKPQAAASPEPPTQSGLSPAARAALKAIVRLAKKYGWAVLFPEGITLNALLLVLEPTELNKGEEEALARLRAEYEFRHGKTLEEIQSHPGGEGYQEHHFLENTKENQLNLPEGVREAPENKGNIPTFSHEDLHAEMSRKSEELGGETLRDSLRGKTIEDQLKAMFDLMKKLRILK